MSGRSEGGGWLRRLPFEVFLIIVGLVIGSVLGTPILQSVAFTRWHLAKRSLTASPTCDDTGWYSEVKPTDVQAFHSYQSGSSAAYSPGNTVDGNRETAWVAPFPTAPDQDWISWRLPRTTTIRLICIRNGYTRNYLTYAGNGRTRTAQLSGCGPAVPLSLPDHVDLSKRELDDRWTEYLNVPVDCKADHVRLDVTATFPAYDNSHLVAISDIRFYEGWRLSDK